MELVILLTNGPDCVRSTEEMVIFLSKFEELISAAVD